LSSEHLNTLRTNLSELNNKLRYENELGPEVKETDKAKNISDKDITFIECESDQDNILSTDTANHPLTNTSGN